ncbi:hypothetical protein ASF41_22150 [Methylobacterium sp. Leaf111]|uniref:beta strand repeat-containing protein n=1 Tax=Methylobacterium sp. Leaf111 TaxID=1736257 RepID=UPI0006F3BAAB|nr:hypothetical protein [Methylobacterium sp. Leaf111]KQP63982.1 hypothetical protein ASF41_22150 [Methylobacterium sp. Leaf111]
MVDVLQLQAGANESDIAQALALLKSGGTLILPANETIDIVDGLKIDVTNRNITIEMNGSTLKQVADNSVISGYGSIINTQNVALDISGENAKVTFTGAIANLKVGDWIKIVSDDVLPYDNRNTEEPTRLGQSMQITAINGNTVELAGKPLYADQYLTNLRAGEIQSGALKLSNGTVVGDQAHSEWISPLVNVRNAIAPDISHVTVRDGNSMGINLANTVNAAVRDSVAINLLDDVTIGHYGYGVHSASSIGTTVIGLYAERVRHATDDNGVVSGINNPNLASYGADIGLHVKDTVSYYASAFSYSFHSEGRNGVLENVMSFESHGFVGFRGVGHQLINSGSVGDERGFQYMEYGYGDSRDTVVDNVIVREAGRYVYVVTGDPANNIIKNSYLEYDLRDGNPGTTQLINTSVIKWNGIDDNIINGSSQGDRLLGGRGVDTISGGDGDDYIWGGEGLDKLTGGAGRDRFIFDRFDSADVITDFQAGAGGDTLDVVILGARYGWSGDFVAKGYVQFVQVGSDTSVMVAPVLGSDYYAIAQLQNVNATSLTVDNVQMTLSGGAAPTALPVATGTVPTGSISYAKGGKIVGTTGADYVDGTHTISGQPLPTLGADTINTDAGDDYVDGLGGADSINAGAGNDTVVYYGGVASNLQGGSGRDVLLLKSNDTIDLSQSDQSLGLPTVSGFDDVDGRLMSMSLTITGNASNNNLWGGGSDDTIMGGPGNDAIDGGDGNDVLLYDGNRDDYSFIRINDNTWRVQDLRGASQWRDYVKNMERVSFDDQTSFIDVLNRPPTDALLDNKTIVEGMAANTLVGTLSGVDPDVSEINQWALLDDAGGRFVIVANKLFSTGAFDYETDKALTIKVLLTDSDGHQFIKDFSIAVTDVNDTAPVLASSTIAVVDENTRFVQTLAATDADSTGEAIVFSIDASVGDGALFEIKNNNELHFINAPDYENQAHAPNYQVQIIASDGVNTSSQLVSVDVRNVTLADIGFGTMGDDAAAYNIATHTLTLNGVTKDAYSIGYDTLYLLAGKDRFEMSAPEVRVSGNQAGLIMFDTSGDAGPEFSVHGTEQLQITGSNISFTAGIQWTDVDPLAGTKLFGTGTNDVINASLAGVAVAISGGAGNDMLTGGSGADTIDGGTGADLMSGGLGDDTYIVDHTGDVVVELAGQGVDTVQTTLTAYTLGADVEDLTFIGAANFTASGNELANVLTSGSGHDRLDGKAGADTMIGGLGNDTYVVDNAGDVVLELVGQGTDRVLSSVSYTLSDNVETLQLSASKNVNGTGNALANTLIGNAGANVLDGRGGADTLTGGGGNDTFVFRLGETQGDKVTDFTGAGATIGDHLEFRGFGAGATFTHAANSDLYTITADAAHGSVSETFQLVGVTNLDLLTGAGHNDVLLFA